jgi:predicted small secreted protein
MKNLRRIFAGLIVAGWVGSIFGSFGCNTVHGLGRDIERGGEKTQDAAESVKRRL